MGCVILKYNIIKLKKFKKENVWLDILYDCNLPLGDFCEG